MQILQQKIIICGNISLVIILWEDRFITYIAFNPISTFLHQFYAGYLAHFAGITTIFFFIAGLIIRLFDKIAPLQLCTWPLLLMRYFFIDNRTWWYLLSSSSFSPTFSASILLYPIYECLVYLDISTFLDFCIVPRYDLKVGAMRIIAHSFPLKAKKKNYFRNIQFWFLKIGWWKQYFPKVLRQKQLYF